MIDFWNFHTTTYLWIVFLMHVVYVAVLVGVLETAPGYIATLESYIKIYVSLFLIVRFNPFMHTGKFTEIDRKIVFSAALIILTTSILNGLIEKFKVPIRTAVRAAVQQVVQPWAL